MSNDANTRPLWNSLVWPYFVELVRSYLQVEPTNVEFFNLGRLGLLAEAGTFLLPSIRIWLETRVHFSLLKPQLFCLDSNHIVDSVPGVYYQLVRLWFLLDLYLLRLLILLLFGHCLGLCCDWWGLSFKNHLFLWRGVGHLSLDWWETRCEVLEHRFGHSSIRNCNLWHTFGIFWLITLLTILPGSWYWGWRHKFGHFIGRAVANRICLLVKIIRKWCTKLRRFSWLRGYLRKFLDKFLVFSCTARGGRIAVAINWLVKNWLLLAMPDGDIALNVHYSTIII